MTTSMLAFDTLRFANRLKAAGVPSAHAEAEAQALAEVFEAQSERVATKANVAELGHALRAEMRELAISLRAEMAVMKWMTGVIVAGVLALILKSFF